jgi:uncharacterized protein YdeI (YjbR/CyaY-like superfamily)
VILEEDLEPRRVEVPEELSSRLEHDRAAREAFEKLAYTHQREYAGWIREAKRAETRSSRADRALEMLKEGKKLR